MSRSPSKPPAVGSIQSPPAGERRYWRSLERLADPAALADAGRLPEALRPEFAVGADLPPGQVTRRTVLGLMGASLGLAGVAGCRRPEEAIVPYVRAPEDVVPGLARHYASAFPLAGDVLGVVVESHEGRPTKVEGNPEHPLSQGAASAWAQASILQLYDPDRLDRPYLRERDTDLAEEGVEVAAGGGGAGAVKPAHEREAAAGAHHGATGSSWADFATFWQARSDEMAGDGSRLAVVAADDASPTLRRLAVELRGRFPGLSWVRHDPNAGGGVDGPRPMHDLEAATVVLALDADLFLTEPGAVAAARGFARGRRPDGGASHEASGDGAMNRLYVVEPMPTVTGGSADHRLRLKASQVAAFAAAVAAELGVGAADGGTGDEASDPLPESALAAVPVVAADLRRAGASALVVAGRRQPAAVHELARRLNDALGATGTTVTYGAAAGDPATAFADLVEAMRGGRLDTVIFLGGNPVYSAPADLDLAGALRRVRHVVHLAHGWDETGAHADWLLPEAGWLEAWGDAEAADGTLSIVQPLVAPLYGGKSAPELVALLAAGAERPGYELVRETWSGLGGEAAWRRTLHRGILPGSAGAAGAAGGAAAFTGAALGGAVGEVVAEEPEAGAAEGGAPDAADDGGATAAPEDGQTAPANDDFWSGSGTATPAAVPAEGAEHGDGHGPSVERDPNRWAGDPGGRGGPPSRDETGDLELIFTLSPSVHDGRFANVAWLQEMPDPVTKVTWANPARVSPATAEALGLEDGDVAVLRHAGHAVRLPVVVQAGGADGTVEVELGYGRHGAGRVGDGVGVNVGPLRTREAPWIARGARLGRTSERFPLARTQEHQSMEGRHLVREADLAQYRQDQRFAERYEVDVEKVTHLWDEPGYDGPHQWGMVIDLNACTGCNACVVACQSENNIPVVGPDQVRKGRELQWLRVDRYFEGDADDARPVFQPVPCMHCENAPCEQVCPVAATVHDEEGLNAMVYNRCIGTRYCSNNCPYKVRRFNYFNFTNDTPELVKAAMNPDVTVRSRGVMEKCTYCVQRINEGKAAAKRARRRLADGEVKTACQETCPAEAITFGDLTDAESAVSRAKRSPRNYVLLAELNNHPRTSYLARIRNPNPDWPDHVAAALPPRGAEAGHGAETGHGDAAGHGEEASH